jgi:hypothetical protein
MDYPRVKKICRVQVGWKCRRVFEHKQGLHILHEGSAVGAL